MRYMVNFNGLTNKKDVYNKRIYLEKEDKEGFLKRLAERDSKIDGISVVTVLRDDIEEEVKAVIVEKTVKEISVKNKGRRTFKCNICNEVFSSGFEVGKHKKKEHSTTPTFKLDPMSV